MFVGDGRRRKTDETQSSGTSDHELVVGDAFVNRNRKRAPDGGWGWMCVIGSMLMHSLVDGYTRSYGLIYVQLQNRFDSSAALTAVVGSACIAVRMCGSEYCLQLGVSGIREHILFHTSRLNSIACETDA